MRNTLKIRVKYVGWDEVDWMYLAYGGDQSCCEHIHDLWACLKCGNFIHYLNYSQFVEMICFMEYLYVFEVS
jgi:hypothetical protein